MNRDISTNISVRQKELLLSKATSVHHHILRISVAYVNIIGCCDRYEICFRSYAE